MNLKKISRIKREYNLVTQIRKKNKYNVMYKKDLGHRTAPNLLRQRFRIKVPDTVYSTDISYLRYNRGNTAYLSAVKDLATGEILMANISGYLDWDSTYGCMQEFLSNRDCGRLTIHSDQGWHYTHPRYVNMLKELGIRQSMSRKGNCLDNAPIESFFGHMKDEVDLKSCETLSEVEKSIAEYVEYYNNERMQWSRNKQTPAERRGYLLATAR